MAKRKAARAAAKAGRGATRKPALAGRSAARTVAVRSRHGVKGGARATGRKTVAARGASSPRKRSAGTRGGKAVARKPAAGRARATARKQPRDQQTARKATRKGASRGAGALASGQAARKVPALNRERRVIRDDDVVPSPPSSLDLDRSASAARTGRRELHEKFAQHTETSPAITGGDIDADWESAYTVGDEAPGGDNPTPDQDIVDDIGRAVGVEYEDNEELKGEKKISDRDRKRWELDPASSEDYEDR